MTFFLFFASVVSIAKAARLIRLLAHAGGKTAASVAPSSSIRP
jgi:hypothetical protein